MFRTSTCLGIKHIIKKSVTTKRLETRLCSKQMFHSEPSVPSHWTPPPSRQQQQADSRHQLPRGWGIFRWTYPWYQHHHKAWQKRVCLHHPTRSDWHHLLHHHASRQTSDTSDHGDGVYSGGPTLDTNTITRHDRRESVSTTLPAQADTFMQRNSAPKFRFHNPFKSKWLHPRR